MKKLLLFGLLICFFGQIRLAAQAYSQSADEQLANQYYQNKQYDKAIVYYDKLFYKNPSPVNYHNYLDCLIKTQDYKTAEKVIKKEIKEQPDNPVLYADMGMLLKQEGSNKDATDWFDKAIHKLSANVYNILTLGKYFSDAKEYDYALKTYE